MRRYLLLLFAVLMAVSGFGQTNIVANKTVNALGGLKTYEKEGGSFTVTQESLNKITSVDANGNVNTANIYLFPEEGGGWSTEANKAKGIQGFYIELDQAVEINSVKTTWQGAAASGKVYVSNTKPADDGTLSGQTEIASFTKVQGTEKTFEVTSTATGKYVIFVPGEATNYDWGVKIQSFQVYDKSEATLGSFSVSPVYVFGANTSTSFTPVVKSTTNVDISSGVTFKVDNNEFTSWTGLSLAAGTHTFSATYGTVTKEAKVVVFDENSGPTSTLPDPADMFEIYTKNTTNTSWCVQWNGGATKKDETESFTWKAQYWEDVRCVFFGNPDWDGTITNNSQYTKLHLDIYALESTSNVLINTENGGPINESLNLSAGWNAIDIDVSSLGSFGKMAVRNNPNGASNPGENLLFANIYLKKVTTVVPKIKSFTVSSATGTTADKLTLSVKVDNDGTEENLSADLFSADVLDFTVNNGTSDITSGYTIDYENKTIQFSEAGTYSVSLKSKDEAKLKSAATAPKVENIVISTSTVTYALKSVTASKTTDVKVDDELTISVTGTPSNNADGSEDITDKDGVVITVTKDGATEAYSTGKTFKPTEAGSYNITVTAATGQTLITGGPVQIASQVVVTGLEIKSLTLDKTENVKTGDEVTLTVLDEKDNDITEQASDVAYTVTNDGGTEVTGLINGKIFKATAAGTYIIKVSAGATSTRIKSGSFKEVTLVVAKGVDTPPTHDNKFKSLYPAEEGTTTVFENYENKYASREEVAIGGQTVSLFKNLGTAFIVNGTVLPVLNTVFNPADQGYASLSMDLYCASAATGKIEVEHAVGNSTNTDFTLTAGEWKTVIVDLSEITAVRNLKIQMDAVSETDPKYPDVYVTNIYYVKAEVKTAEINTVSLGATEITTKGSATVTVLDKDDEAIIPANVTLTVKKQNGTDYVETTDAAIADGKFTASAKGTYQITATPKEGVTEISGSASATITVTAAEVAKLTVTPNAVSKGVETALTFKVTDSDNNELDNSKLTFKVGNDVFTSGSNYTGSEIGTVTVTVASADENVYVGSATATLTIVNPLPDATQPTNPEDDAANVDAILSHYYEKAVKDHNPAWGGGPNPLWASYEEVEAGTGKVWKVTGTGLGDRPNTTPKAGDYQYINVSVFPNSATEIKVYQDKAYANALTATVTPRQWNYITLPCNFTEDYYAFELVNENSFYMDNFYLSKLPAGTTGINSLELSEEFATTNVDLPLTVTVKGTKDDTEVTIDNADLDFTITPATATLTAGANGYTFKATTKGTYTIAVAPKATATTIKGSANATIVVSDVVTLGSLTVDPATVASKTETALTFTVKDTAGDEINSKLVDIALADETQGTLTADNKFTASVVEGKVKFVVTPKEGVSSVKAATADVTAEVTVTKQPLTIYEKDEKGIVTVTGGIATAEDQAKITAIDALVIDLRGAAFDASIKKITPKYDNAILIVDGEVATGATTGTSTVAAQLSETKNLVLRRGDGYYFPVKEMEITSGLPVWTDFFVSGNTYGWKMTHTVAANTMEMVVLPAAATLPEGLIAYTISSNSAEKMELRKDGPAQYVPAVLYNSTASALTLTITSKDNLDFRTTETRTLQKDIETGVKAVGTFTEVTAPTGAQTLTVKDGEPVLTALTGAVKPLGAYLLVTTKPALIIAQGLNEPQEIKTIAITIDDKEIQVGTATDLKLKVTDADNQTIDNAKLTFTANPATVGTFGEDGKFTAKTAGEFTVKVAPKSGEKYVTGSAESAEKVTAVEKKAVQNLKKLTIGATKIYVGVATDLKLAVTDDSEEPKTIANTKLTFTVTPADAGDLTAAGVFTAKKAGKFTITAKPNEDEAYLSGSASADATAETMVTMELPTIPTPVADSIYAAIYTNTVTTANATTTWGTAYNGGATQGDEITVEKNVAMPFYAASCVFFGNTTLADDIYNVNINPSAKEYGKLHLHAYSPEATTISVVLEQVKTIAGTQKFELKAKTWTEIEVDLDGETNIKAMSVRSEAADLALANIYFTKAAENPDSNIVAKVTVAKAIVAKNTATDLGLTVTNNKGVELRPDLYTLSADKGTFDKDGLFTATADGPITITATSTVNKEREATVTVNTLPSPATAPTDDKSLVLAVYSDTYGVSAFTPTEKGWNNGYGNAEAVELAKGDNAIMVTEAGTFGLKLADVNLTDYQKLNAAIYSAEAYEGYIQIEGTQVGNMAVSLKANQWNYITVLLTGTRTAATYVQLYTGPKESTNTILVDNVYFSKLGADEMIISDPDEKEVTSVVGHVTKNNISEIEALDVMALNLSDADLASDVTSINLKNKNAIVIVSGTMDGNEVVASAMAAQLKGVQNLVVQREDGYLFPVKKLVITDGEPVYTGFMISGNSKGWEYRRTFDPGVLSAAYLPGNVRNGQPEGLKAYKYDGKDDEGLHFSDAELLERQPRLVMNTTSEPITIVVRSKADLDLRPTDLDVDATGLVFAGTLSGYERPSGMKLYDVLNISGSQARTRAAADESTLKSVKAELPFRAFFLSDSKMDTSTSVDVNGQTTSISSIVRDLPGTGAVYNMQGVRVDDVDNLRPGIYIRDGKKFVVK